MPYVTFKNLDRAQITQIADGAIAGLVNASGAPIEAFRIYDGGSLVASGDGNDSVLAEVVMYPRPADQMKKMAGALYDAVNTVKETDVHVIFLNISGFEYHYRNGNKYRTE